MTLPVVFTANGPTGYNLTNSLRFRSSASAYLNRTPASAGNRQTWTYSAWVKRGALNGSIQFLMCGGSNASGQLSTQFQFDGSNRLYLYGAVSGGSSDIELVTTAVYRDPSAWYHIVLVADTTQATSTNRIKLYVNGVQVTSFSTSTYPAQNYNTAVNNNVLQNISNLNNLNVGLTLDGYVTETIMVDGQALTPSSFGSFNALTGVWQPAKYTGTYGTNGFYLPFTDNSALTTSSNVGLGKDFSGNGNYWTTNNISITAGVTYDSMTDVPTLTSATTANYCVVSPIAYRTSTPTPTITNGNLTVVCPSASFSSIGASTFGVSSGKWYWETTKTGTSYGNTGVALAPFNQTISSSFDFGSESNEYAYVNNGSKFNSNSLTSYGASYTNGDVIGVALDLDNGTLTFYKNNTSQGVAFSSLPSGIYIVGCYDSFNGSGFQFNFGQRPFSYTPPTGFVALNTFNLPTSTIVAGNKQMDATTYTGNGSTQTIVNSGGMQPDLVWIKPRAAAVSHSLYDSVRGAFIALASNTTDADANYSPYGVTSFNSNGFSLNDVASGGYRVNGSPGGAFSGASAAYIGWQWKAGGTAVTNTAGSISAQVSANTTAGFSVVTYTGNGTAGATIGHGLGVAPSMVIAKNRSTGGSAAYEWTVYHVSLGATKALFLNDAGAAATDAGYWYNTAPTSSVITVPSNTRTNVNGSNFVFYCFAQIAGYSAFGSYTGNGSADGPFVYTGFRPRYVMWKRSDSTGDWIIFDSSRNPYNYADLQLCANTSGAEQVTGGGFVREDLLSNGFKVRSTDSYINANGGTYIYMAFAENPFKNALAR